MFNRFPNLSDLDTKLAEMISKTRLRKYKQRFDAM